MGKILGSAAVLSIALTGLFAPSASAAMPLWEGAGAPQVLYSIDGKLESVIVGNSGRLYFSSTPTGNTTSSQLLKIDRPGATPELVTSAPPGPGGLSWDKRRLLWGYGNTAANGATGDVNPVAGLNSVNPVNGKKFNVSKTLGMANGIAKAPNGAIFASNDFGQKMDRITTKGFTINGWALVDKANGLTISPDGKFIYANLIFSVPPTIASIEIADAANVTTYAAAPADTPMSILDGLTRDDAGNLYVAAWGKGEVWKVDTSGNFCVLASGLSQTSSLYLGRGRKGFKAGSLYVVGFDGKIVKVPGAYAATQPS